MNKQWLLLGLGALRHSRKLKIALIASALLTLLFLVLAIWAAISLFGWIGGQVPGAWEKVKEQAPAVQQRIEEVVPGAGQAAERLLPGQAPALQDVAGEDIGGVPRFAGLVRTRYSVEGAARSVTYEGEASFRAVADHYAARFLEKGWTPRLLYADAREERREYLAPTSRFELHIKEGERVSVTLREEPLAAAGGAAAPAR